MSPTLKFVKNTKIIFKKISCDIHSLKTLSASFNVQSGALFSTLTALKTNIIIAKCVLV